MSLPRPFRVDVPQEKLDVIRTRLRISALPPEPDDAGEWNYGIDGAFLNRFIDHWVHAYDWQAAQARLNKWPQYVARVDGLDVHFYHVRGSGRGRALVLTHGWPGSTLEFMGMVEPLAFPDRYGGDPALGFDLVIPTLPGYGFSQAAPRPIGPRRIASLWRKLMTEVLGYERFGAQGGDWGSAVSTFLGADHGDVVAGIHLNMVAAMSRPVSPPSSDEETAYWRTLSRVQSRSFGYHQVQTENPQTIAAALSDSPVGYAAWVLEKFNAWSDASLGLEQRFGLDDLITNLMITLVNDAVATSIWLYRGRATEAAKGGYAGVRVEVPTAVAQFPAEFIPYPPRGLAEQTYNITRWTIMPAGGHFAALEEPVALSDDIREFFSQVL
ncbi:epoxide hydrolase (plasmid) [Novosphingobium resinovorum]|uniref:epoxide hydrolase family protein n=1 Tax=Novosphingobium TaxID=165696 RepID=UPI001B3C786D|nr:MULTISPECIES: epoxide hydrolase family protein [Novosphingobium]MBF7015335.1 alpha/beta fold hydrolase [Novosphingobium sp. HR1a]WJM30012.1 epoxide hydrolase [Novosphingobium resinovorum]